ncbi:DUF1992 domain-containing protein [Paenibacillus sp.]|jgi:hypothetical protein|uniref:DnaJ family domain-containing protein n=1 Tax=Paenibacillus sp. TaxID=58172 RepID=UPI002822F385|nr:DUF1992 domain-containing protein [Paenibacillus sp.]MDR0268051.1 DUF1992 domain-containing protein [Paenibacillus sp.]
MEDAPATIMKERLFNHWMDETLSDFEKRGSLKELPGFGKPLKLTEGDPFHSILKNANYLPPWIELQKEICKSLEALINQMEYMDKTGLDFKFDEINQKIRKYNNQVPSHFMQKMIVTTENIQEQYQKWC